MNAKDKSKKKQNMRRKSAKSVAAKKLVKYVIAAVMILVVFPCGVYFALRSAYGDFWSNPEQSDSSAKKHSSADAKRDSKQDSKRDFIHKTDDCYVRVTMSKSGKKKVYKRAEYLTGVLCAEVPMSFSDEALMAQAVVSRTYAYSKKKHICDNYAHCQAFISKKKLKKTSGSYGLKKWRHMKKMVENTENLIITWHGKPANPLFHACSGGRTENASDVWGGGAPYLTSVESPGEEFYDGFEHTADIPVAEYLSAMNKLAPSSSSASDNIKIEAPVVTAYTKSGRVKTVQYKNRSFTGVQIRTALNLRSTFFSFDMSKVVSDTEGMVRVMTKGYGHGVGMSQYGAEAMARSGKKFDEILLHYYKGVKLKKL